MSHRALDRAARVGDHRAAFDELDAPIERVAAPNVPVPFAPALEAAVSPSVATIVAAVRRTVGLGP